MGIVVGGFGGGAMVFNQIQTAIVNFENYQVIQKFFKVFLQNHDYRISANIRRMKMPILLEFDLSKAGKIHPDPILMTKKSINGKKKAENGH